MNKKLEWIKEHKKEILIGTGMIVGTAVLIVIGVKRSKSSKSLAEDLLVFKSDTDTRSLIDAINSAGELDLTPKVVDEDIFTMLAPAIEQAVLDEGLEKLDLERVYFGILNGGPLSKVVTVKVESVYGD